MKIDEHILTKNDCWKSGKTIKPKGVMVHSLGVAQPNVNVFLDTWNRPGLDACVHAFVSKDGVTQTLPWNWRGWHCGRGTSGKSANDTHISFEICEPAGHKYNGGTMVGYDVQKNAAYFVSVYQNAVEFAAYLCNQYDLDPLADGVLICHSEGYQRGIASNHADVMHWFPKHGKSMDTFRADVSAKMKGDNGVTQHEFDVMMGDWLKRQNEKQTNSWAKESWDKAVKKGYFDGTMPQGFQTREQSAVIMDRQGLLD